MCHERLSTTVDNTTPAAVQSYIDPHSSLFYELVHKDILPCTVLYIPLTSRKFYYSVLQEFSVTFSALLTTVRSFQFVNGKLL